MNLLSWQIEDGHLFARITGYGAIISLLVSQLVTPIVRSFPALKKPKFKVRPIRKWSGILAALLAVLHSSLLFVTYLQGQFGELLDHAWLTAGVAALLIFGALLVTSFKAAMRFLGPSWKILHRASYVLTFLIVLHLWGTPSATWATCSALLVAGALLLVWRWPVFQEKFTKK